MNAIIEETLVRCDAAEANGLMDGLTPEQRGLLDKARALLMAGDDLATHAVSVVLDRVIKVPVYRWATVEREFSRLVAKAEQRKLPVPVLTEIARDDRWVTCHVLGGAPVFAGWRLVADLERLRKRDTGEVVTLVRTAVGQTCPERYRSEPEQCEHCGVRRQRNRTFVIRHEDGRYLQIGSTCLDEYLGTDALSAWLTLGPIRELSDGWGLEIWDEDEYTRYRGHVSKWGAPVPLAEFLPALAASVRVYGYSSAKSEMHPNLATGRSTWAAIQECEHEAVTEGDRAYAQELLAFGRGLRGSSDFEHNLRCILESGEVRWTDANLVAALVPMLAAEQARLNEHVPGAEPGTKIVGEWRVVSKRSWLGLDGYMYRVSFRDAAGREITWRTGSPWTVAGESIEVGKTYRVVATVKRLGSYEGMAQTEISRPSVYEVGTETAGAKAAMRKYAKAIGVAVPEWAWTDAQRKRAAKER